MLRSGRKGDLDQSGVIMCSLIASMTLGDWVLAAAGVWLGICVVIMLLARTPRLAFVALLKTLPYSLLPRG